MTSFPEQQVRSCGGGGPEQVGMRSVTTLRPLAPPPSSLVQGPCLPSPPHFRPPLIATGVG